MWIGGSLHCKLSKKNSLWKTKFTGTWKRLKLVRIDQQKMNKKLVTVQNKATHRKYTHLWQICTPINKILEDVLETARK